MVLLSGNKTKTKSKPTVNPNAKIVEAVCSHSNGAPSLHAKDRNEFVREVPTPIYVRFFLDSSRLRPFVHTFHFSVRSCFDRRILRSWMEEYRARA